MEDVRERMLRHCQTDIDIVQDKLESCLRFDENADAARRLRDLIRLKNEFALLESLSVKDLEGMRP